MRRCRRAISWSSRRAVARSCRCFVVRRGLIVPLGRSGVAARLRGAITRSAITRSSECRTSTIIRPAIAPRPRRSRLLSRPAVSPRIRSLRRTEAVPSAVLLGIVDTLPESACRARSAEALPTARRRLRRVARAAAAGALQVRCNAVLRCKLLRIGRSTRAGALSCAEELPIRRRSQPRISHRCTIGKSHCASRGGNRNSAAEQTGIRQLRASGRTEPLSRSSEPAKRRSHGASPKRRVAIHRSDIHASSKRVAAPEPIAATETEAAAEK
jgi:hypothetical protein